MNLPIIGEGKTTKVYRDGDRAVKLYTGAPPEEAHNEARRQTFAYEAGLPVPKVFGVRELAEGTALDMKCINGEPLLTPRMEKDARHAAIERMVELQCRVHSIDAAGQPGQADAIAWKIDHCARLSEPQKYALQERLSRLSGSQARLCHGDFHPLNILNDGNKLWIIDWVDSRRGNPLADACRTYLIFRQYLPRIAGIYLRLYCEKARANREDVLAWLPVLAGARLWEKQTEKEAEFLLGIVREDAP